MVDPRSDAPVLSLIPLSLALTGSLSPSTTKPGEFYHKSQSNGRFKMRRIIGIGSVPERRPFVGPGCSPLTNPPKLSSFPTLPLTPRRVAFCFSLDNDMDNLYIDGRV